MTFKKTSNALVTLVKTKQDCLKKLLKTIGTTRQISELVRQRVPDRRTGDRKRLTAECVETTASWCQFAKQCMIIHAKMKMMTDDETHYKLEKALIGGATSARQVQPCLPAAFSPAAHLPL